MLAPEELADFRGVATDSLEGRCSISRITRVRQPNNSWKDTPVVAYTDVPCRKVPADRTPQELAITEGMLGNRGLSMFRLDSTKLVYRDDTITYLGKAYDVAGVLDRTAQIYLTVYVYDDMKAPPGP